MVRLQYKIQLSLAKHTNAIVGTILEAPIVKNVCVKMVGLVKGKVVSARKIGKENSVKNENVKMMELGLRLENVNVQRCMKANFVKLVDAKTEGLVLTLSANVHQPMKESSVKIKNVETEASELRRENANVQKCLKVNFARTACAKTASVATINAVVPTILMRSFVNSLNSKSKKLEFVNAIRVSFFILEKSPILVLSFRKKILKEKSSSTKQ
jgi:hypothetical protein